MTNVHSTDLPPILGYKGFRVEVFPNSVLRRTLVIGSCKEPDVEMLLLETVQDLRPVGDSDTIGDSIIHQVRQELQHATADGGDNINITLHIFSGRPDPVWTIHQTNRNYQSILDKMTNVHSTDLPPVLGYKGFTVDVIRNSVLRRTLVIGSCKEPGLETLLLETVKNLPPMGDTHPMGKSLMEYVTQSLQNC
ncbi:uncharacterized protein LOC132729876 isoform X2 [Ruditapes philippinarum]|uniref:uncharacterized protein LOC132729876 isoform X2 n=1 Tax=Ruditapes philippinarum TaxID=129788 RepID=UPI00295B174D|nr:uncharacterized protein LOC132729876 isoform X2 [Ruditapes philippinarum]